MKKSYIKKILFISLLTLFSSFLIPDSSFYPNKQRIFQPEIHLHDSDFKNKLSTSFINNYANLTGHGWRVREVAFSDDNSILASGSSDGSIRLWNLTDGKVINVLCGHHYGVVALDFNPSDDILASGGVDTKINLWNVSSGELLKTWSLFPHAVIDLKWSPDGKTLAVGGGEWMGDVIYGNQPERFFQLLNATTGEVQNSFMGHTNAVSSLSFSKNGSMVISGSWDNNIKLWNVSSGTEIRSFVGHTDKITSLTFSHDESIIISGSLDQTVKLWDISTGFSNELNTNHSIWCIDLSPVNNHLAVAVDPLIEWPIHHWYFYGQMHDCMIQLWDITTGMIIDTLTGHRNTIESVKFSQDGTIIASASWDWTVKLWGNYPSLTIDDSLDAWPTSTPEEQGIDSVSLNISLSNLNEYRFHSILVIRHGKLIFERYYSDYSQVYSPIFKHVQFSATKSFTSTLIGIAIDKGFINSTEQQVLDFFPDKTILNLDSRKEAITLHHLLSMTTGMEWDDTSDIWGMVVSNDSVEYVLSKPMVIDPGSMWSYNSGASQLLSAIIQKTTNYTTREFAMKYLFRPLGIDSLDVIWMMGSDGINFGGIGLFLTPRNMAKLGQLYLNNGTWNGEQIISSNWIKSSSYDHIEGLPRHRMRPGFATGYGYQFWIRENMYFAAGHGGQTIQIVPEHNFLVVTTCREQPVFATNMHDRVKRCIISDHISTTSDYISEKSFTTTKETTTMTESVLGWNILLIPLSFIVTISINHHKNKLK